MSDRAQVEAVIQQFFEALNSDDASGVLLSDGVEYIGILMSDPVCGETDVREHLQQIAPFMLNVKHGQMIIEAGSVAILTEFDGVNDIHVDGAFFMDVEDGKISRIRAIFDSRTLLSGSN